MGKLGKDQNWTVKVDLSQNTSEVVVIPAYFNIRTFIPVHLQAVKLMSDMSVTL